MTSDDLVGVRPLQTVARNARCEQVVQMACPTL